MMMKVLGIETSCDDTAASVVTQDGFVLSSIVSSQIDLHMALGGVVPEIASRAHLRLVLPVVREALAGAGLRLEDLGGIAVTMGPGLIGALLVGVQTAKALGWSAGLPVVGVHHLDGHMAAPFLRQDASIEPPAHPYVALVASGGHTCLIEVVAQGRSRTLGRTRDDAAGEALDKGAKLMGLGYPGGPAIEKEASKYEGPDAPPFPRGLHGVDDLDFSFSGVKTALVTRVRAFRDGLDAGSRGALALAYEEAIVDSLVTKAMRACALTGIPRLVVCGGVASNSRLRAELARRAVGAGVEIHVPPAKWCTDNAAMIAMAGMDRLQGGANEVMGIVASPVLDLQIPASW